MSDRPLAYDDRRHLEAHQFLVEEAHLLDSLRFEDWLDLVDEKFTDLGEWLGELYHRLRTLRWEELKESIFGVSDDY